MTDQNDFMRTIADKLSPWLVKIEVACWLIALAGFFIKSHNHGAGGVILILSLGILAVIYFISARASLAPTEEPVTDAKMPAIRLFLQKLMFWGCSAAVLGILFRLQSYNGNNYLLIIGWGVLSFVLVFNMAKKADTRRQTIIRTLIILAIALFLYFAPNEKLKEYKIIQDNEIVNDLN